MPPKAPRSHTRTNSRAAILDAAEEIAAETGANHVTLEAVADRAGVSKGGLLYNFPSKDALLAAMVARYVERVREALGGDKTQPEGLLKALVITRLAGRECGPCGPASCSMAAALAERPDLLKPVRDLYRDIWQAAREAPNARAALLAWLAVEGLMFLELTDTSPLSADERAQMLRNVEAALRTSETS